MRNSGAYRLARRIARPLRRFADRRSARGGILMYHRVAHEACDPWRLCVTPAAFDEQMAVIANAHAAVDLADFAGHEAYDRGGAHIAVTFDDAYVDNITQALPILERHGVPATIFVVSATLGRKREFWWDGLVRAVLEAPVLPATLELMLGNQDRVFTVTDAPGDAARARDWNADDDEPRTPRERLYLELWSAIVTLTPEQQDQAAADILAWAGAPAAAPVDRLPATAEAIAKLATHPLIRIGSHTRDHLSLPGLSDAAQREQIESGHRTMETIVGRRIDRFSYPFGRYDDRARAHVRALGVDVACTSMPTAATRRMNRLELPRLHAVERDGDAFLRWLREDHRLLASTGAR